MRRHELAALLQVLVDLIEHYAAQEAVASSAHLVFQEVENEHGAALLPRFGVLQNCLEVDCHDLAVGCQAHHGVVAGCLLHPLHYVGQALCATGLLTRLAHQVPVWDPSPKPDL